MIILYRVITELEHAIGFQISLFWGITYMYVHQKLRILDQVASL